MTKFKVGDRVRCVSAEYSGLTIGREYVVTRIDGSEGYCEGVVVIDDDGESNTWGRYELANSENDELAELRAFREEALASGYVPAEPDKPETDGEAAERLQEEYWDDKLKRPADVALAAFAWARANPPIDKP